MITIIYDQSGRGNNLTQAPAGGAAGGPDNLANAVAAPTTLHGHKAYGVYVAPGTGYRDNHTSGIATGNQPEGEYAIFDGTHFNGGCCFDYGNAQSGALSTFYDGKRPNVSGYNPIRKQGVIILGTGGDNSKGSAGTFYEGVMTSGYPSDATQNAVQANIIAAGYGANS